MNTELEKIVKPLDFTDCAFANRKPDRGFLAVAHNGGPARGFSTLMAPVGGAPRSFVTAKAFPEDEAVVSTAADSGRVVTKFIDEKRFGALNQFEIIVPLFSADRAHRGTLRVPVVSGRHQ